MNVKSLILYKFQLMVVTMISAVGLLALTIFSISRVSAAVNKPTNGIDRINAPSAEHWRKFADMQQVRGDPGIVEYNGKINVVGGYYPGGMGYIAAQELYDPQTNSWQYRADMPIPRSDMMVAASGGNIYAFGGWATYLGGVVSYTHMYDPIQNNWITKTSLITPVSGAGVVVMTGTIYILGGYDNLNVFNYVQKYHPISDTWSVGTPMMVKRSEFSAVVLNGKIYAIGGVLPSGIVTSSVEVYDPVADQWTMGQALPAPRASMAVGVRRGNIYVVGGTDDWVIESPQNTAYVFDPVMDLWTTVNPLPTARRATRAAVISDTIYVIGGLGDPGAGSANEGFGFQAISSTTTILSDAPDPSQYNQPFTVTYQIGPSIENPSGVVTVTVANRPESCIGSVVNGGGSCQLAISALGTHTITATYGGKYILTGSADSVSHTVVKANTNTSITSDIPDPSVLGRPITVTFTVSSYGVPTGSVTVSVSGRSETCSNVLTGGSGSCSLTIPVTGVFTLVANYSGDARFNPSTGNAPHVVDLYKLFLPLLHR